MASFVQQPIDSHDFQTDGFKLRTQVLLKKFQSELLEAVFAHVEIDCEHIRTAPVNAQPEVVFQLLRGLVENCRKLQKVAFDRFLQFLAIDRITSTLEQNRCLLWATELFRSCIVGYLSGWLLKVSGHDQGEAQSQSSLPAWLYRFAELASPWLNNNDQPGAAQAGAQERSGSGEAPMMLLIGGLNSKFDFNRQRLIADFLVPAMDAHSEANERKARITREEPHSDPADNLFTDQALSHASIRRAKLVESVIEELTYLRPRMMGQEGDYKAAKEEFPNFVTFQVCDLDRKLKQKLIDIADLKQVVTFAEDIVARKSNKSLATIADDRKKYNKEKRKRQSESL